MCAGRSEHGEVLRYRDFDDAGADERRKALLMAATLPDSSVALTPSAALGFPFRPAGMVADYMSWPRVPELFPSQFPGIITARDPFVVDIDRHELERRLDTYFDPAMSDDEVRLNSPTALADASRFEPIPTRRTLVARGLLPERVVEYQYRPFDTRWIYWEPETKLLHEKRSEYWPTAQSRTPQFVMAQKQRRGYDPPVITTATVAFHLLERGALAFPLAVTGANATLLEGQSARPNLTPDATRYLGLLSVEPDSLFWHTVAILHSSTFFADNEGALGLDWPRVPLPASDANLRGSRALGIRVGSLLDGDDQGFGANLGGISAVAGGMLSPSTDLGVTARWGCRGRGGITMPSTGKLTERAYTADELAAIAEHAESLGMSGDQAIQLLGETCFDVYLNDVAYWRCVPANVWRYTIGGYQVIKKWLSYRERALLGRDLKSEEARYVTEMVRRIAALVLMQPELDANYERVKADVWEWGS